MSAALGRDTSAHASAAAYGPRRRVLVLVVVALAFVMDLLDATILTVAVPSVQASLGASAAQVQWLLAGYTLAFSVLLMTGGRLGDVLGYRTLFLTGVGGFTLASLLCGLAPTAAWLVGARLLQGVAAALMVPQVMALMQLLYPPEKRVKVFVVFGILGGSSAALGPVLGGLLLQADLLGLGWRMVFLVNLPVGLFSMVAGCYLLPPGRGVQRMPLDGAGTLLSIALATSLALPLIEGPELGWPAWTLALLALCPALAWSTWRYLAWRTARVGSALVSPALLRLPGVWRGLSCSLCLQGIVPGYMLALTLVLQTGQGMSPLRMAAVSLPVALGAMLGISLLGQRLLPYLGTRLIVAGVLVKAASLLAVGLAIQARQAHADAPLWPLLLGQLGMGVGLGFCGPPLSAVTLQDAPLADAGASSGLVSAVQQLAGALGVAVVGWVFFTALGTRPTAAAYPQAFWHTLGVLLCLLGLGGWLSLRLPALRHAAAAPHA